MQEASFVHQQIANMLTRYIHTYICIHILNVGSCDCHMTATHPCSAPSCLARSAKARPLSCQRFTEQTMHVMVSGRDWLVCYGEWAGLDCMVRSKCMCQASWAATPTCIPQDPPTNFTPSSYYHVSPPIHCREGPWPCSASLQELDRSLQQNFSS